MIAIPGTLCIPLLAAHISVVTTSGVAGYDDALAGFKSAAAAGNSIEVIDLARESDRSALPRVLAAKPADLIVVIGSNALECIRSLQPGVPVVSAMTLRGQGPPAVRLAGRVDLDIAPEEILGELQRLIPGSIRAGLIYDPETLDPAPWRMAGRQKGVVIEAAPCAAPDRLLDVFRALSGKIDFLIAVPDSKLYNGTTVRPLILASLDRRIPVVGFSASFVRAGAALGVFPDYHEVGRQAAELALRASSGTQLQQGPRKLVVAANPTVLRLLGLELKDSSRKDVSFLR